MAAGPEALPGSPRLDAARLAINAAWLAQLRWVAVAGQLATIAVVEFALRIDTPAGPLLTLVAVTALTNLVFGGWVRRHGSRDDLHTRPAAWHTVLGGLMLLDLLVLSAMLSLTGGPTNPLVLFYFVNLALCGVLLPPRWAWLLGGMAIVAFALISYRHLPLETLRDPDRLQSFAELGRPHVTGVGALAGFAACSAVIVSFVTRLTGELRRAQEARLHAEELRARSEKLEALGTLAAGAAHELATPLSTIAVAAGELARELDDAGVSDEAVDDLRLIRESLARCRRILDRMSTDSGQAAGEAPIETTAGRLIDEVLGELADGYRVELAFADRAADTALLVPPTALSQALRAVVQNALDATADRGVRVAVAPSDGRLEVTVRDSGPGMSTEVLARAGEPFFTTKEPGRGMGLGLYLARSVIERLGGELSIDSEAGRGTTVCVTLPLAPISDAASPGGDR